MKKLLSLMPLYFDVIDEDDESFNLTFIHGIEINGAEYVEGGFSCANNTKLGGSGTLFAPSLVNMNGTTYVCVGHRIDKKSGNAWIPGTPVTDGANVVDYVSENTTDELRWLWLWTDLNYHVDKRLLTWNEYMRSKEFVGNEKVTATFLHADWRAGKLFDGIECAWCIP